MELSSPPNILILTQDAVAADRWAKVLTLAGFHVWQAASAVPEAVDLDLCLTDHADFVANAGAPPPSNHLLAPDQQSSANEPQSPVASCGIVAIGCDARADVCLPSDAADRELVLACRLLTQIVRLRRQQDRSAHTQQQLAQLAFTDPLTGLPNRRAWDEQLAARIAAAASSDSRLCVALFDLDLFKHVNDQDGHAAGDALLRATAESLKRQVRQADFVARLGGDEFGVLLPGVTVADATAVVDRVRAAIGQQSAPGVASTATASAGYALSSGTSVHAEAAYSMASAALQHAKQAGRNRTSGSN